MKKIKLTNNGFTLIEIMIVITIIGIMSAFVVFKISNVTYRSFLSEANKLSQTFEMLQDEAIYTDSVIKCSVNSTKKLECNRYRDGEWQEMDLDKLIEWKFPNNFTIEQIKDNNSTSDSSRNTDMYFYPHGADNLYHIKVKQNEYSLWIDNDLRGKYNVSN